MVYKFNLTGGLTLHLGLPCLLLLLDCLRSDLSVQCIIIVHFVFISLVWFQVVLCFSIDDTIFCSHLVTSRFLAKTCDCGWIPSSVHRV